MRLGFRGTVAGCRRWETGPRTARLTPLILAAALALAGCASSAHLGKPGPAQGGSGCAPATGAGAGPGTCPTQTAPAAAGSSPQPSPSLSSSEERNWPSLVVEIMSYAQRRTAVPVWAPAALPALPQPPNSAEVRAGESMYLAQLFVCPQPQPLNSPSVGSGACGAMASIYGNFGASAYPSQAAARTSFMAGWSPAQGCADSRSVPIDPGLTATLFYSPASPSGCAAVWQDRGWQFDLYGDMRGGQPGDASPPWLEVARSVATHFEANPLPSGIGLFRCDIAADGLHSSASWVVGSDLYHVALYHGAVRTVELLQAMAPYPGAS